MVHLSIASRPSNWTSTVLDAGHTARNKGNRLVLVINSEFTDTKGRGGDLDVMAPVSNNLDRLRGNCDGDDSAFTPGIFRPFFFHE